MALVETSSRSSRFVRELQKAGHRPRIASHSCFKDWVEGEGIPFKDIGSERINQPDEWLTAKNIKDFYGDEARDDKVEVGLRSVLQESKGDGPDIVYVSYRVLRVGYIGEA